MREFNALEKQFMVEIEAKYPGFYDFKQGPTGSFWLPDTCSAYAGYELALELHGGESPVKEYFILELAETRVHHSDPEFWEPNEYQSDTTVYQVSTRKLEEWVKDHEYEYRYIQNIIEACLNGAWHHASRKYSFGDTPNWWDGLKPEANCEDPVKRMAYEVVLS